MLKQNQLSKIMQFRKTIDNTFVAENDERKNVSLGNLSRTKN